MINELCDGLLSNIGQMPDGNLGKMWIIDCPKKETCQRYLGLLDSVKIMSIYVATHSPSEVCPKYLGEEGDV